MLSSSLQSLKKYVSRATRKVRTLHTSLQNNAYSCLDKMSNSSEPDESDIVAAFGDVRVHTKSSEPYYWEQVYRRVSSDFPIPIDNNGKAQLFSPFDATNNRTKQDGDSDNSNKKEAKWQCNPDLCYVSCDMITGTIILLHRIISTTLNNCLTLYAGLN